MIDGDLASMPEWQVWIVDTLPTAIAVYTWLLMLVGLVVSILCSRRFGGFGFYIVAIYFCSPAFAWGMSEVSYLLHRKQIDAHVAEQNWSLRSGDTIPQVQARVGIPVFETILVSGLVCVLLGRKKAAQPGATDNPDDAQRLREDH